MRKNSKKQPKRIVTVESNKATREIVLVSIVKCETNEDYTDEFKEKCPGLVSFSNLDDMKESLNWCLNGDSKKYEFRWIFNGKTKSIGEARIYD